MTLNADVRVMALYARARTLIEEIVASENAFGLLDVPSVVSKIDALMYEAAEAKAFLLSLPEVWVEHKACEPECCNKEAR